MTNADSVISYVGISCGLHVQISERRNMKSSAYIFHICCYRNKLGWKRKGAFEKQRLMLLLCSPEVCTSAYLTISCHITLTYSKILLLWRVRLSVLKNIRRQLPDLLSVLPFFFPFTSLLWFQTARWINNMPI